MHNTKLQDLLNKKREGTINDHEMALLENWYAAWQPEAKPLSHQEIEQAKVEVWQAVKPGYALPVKRQLWPRLIAAASLVFLVSATGYYFTQVYRQPKAAQAKVFAEEKIDFKPGGNKAILTLSNGQNIHLNHLSQGTLAMQGGVMIRTRADGQLVYDHPQSGVALRDTLINKMSTPSGGQYSLILSDGTQVWLNAASTITYPVQFSGTTRKVQVNGEAYFEVAHDPAKPFIVQTGNQEIRVLGTHFNVKAYNDDAGISTTLLAGSIRIKNLSSGKSELLKPGQQAKVFADQQDISIKTVNAEDFVSWKNGYFIFDNQSIKSVMKIMSRWYDIDVVYDNLNKEDRFGGTFSRSSNLSEILHNLEHVSHIHFKMQAKKVIVTD